MITVNDKGSNKFAVTVSQGGSSSQHTVTLTDDYHQKLAGGRASKEVLIEKSFEFLLEREPKESILSTFELPVIGRYFPEYESRIGSRL